MRRFPKFTERTDEKFGRVVASRTANWEMNFPRQELYTGNRSPCQIGHISQVDPSKIINLQRGSRSGCQTFIPKWISWNIQFSQTNYSSLSIFQFIISIRGKSQIPGRDKKKSSAAGIYGVRTQPCEDNEYLLKMK